MLRLDNDVRFITPFDEEFPEKLKFIPSAPKGLYVKGKLPDENAKSVAIIGSRDCSAYGASMSRYFAEVLSNAGVQIISGMARGVDGIAQRAAMNNGHPTFGVLGGGIDVVYPKSNKDIFDGILKTGGLISEFAPGTQPIARQFPSRNRIIAGLADIVLVIEAKIRSGTGITVRRAIEQGRDVYAVPGRITDPLSAGCNKVIEDGAGVALTPERILEILGIFEEKSENFNKISTPRLANREKMVYSGLDLYPKSLEELTHITGVGIPELLGVLLQLELKGLVSECGKNNYIRKT